MVKNGKKIVIYVLEGFGNVVSCLFSEINELKHDRLFGNVFL